MSKAIDLLEIQRQALEANSSKALGFVITNQTMKLMPYKQAIFWTGSGASVNFESASGNVNVDEKGPYGIWLKNIIKKQSGSAQAAIELSGSDILPQNQKEPWCADHVLMLFLYGSHGEILGGILLERDSPFKDAEKALLEELRPVWNTRLSLLLLEKTHRILSWWKLLKKRQKYIWLAVLLLAFFPVRLTITAPAEIVAKEKMVASVPYDGIVKTILVKPGDRVKEGQILAEMESEELKSQAQSAERALETARSSLSRLKREALEVPEKKAEINILQAEIQAREIEYQYAQTMLERSRIKSPRTGVAVFADANEFQGKPAVTGEALIEITSPEDAELLVRIPVDALVPFEKSDPVNFYLNVAPLKKQHADITSIGYQASPDPDGLLTYKLRADIQNPPEDLRIGWKATAKIHGAWTVLAYSILRRPLIALRQLGGR